MARMHPILCGTIVALSACAAPPQKPAEPAPDPISAHQDPSSPNTEALPSGVEEWINYACCIEDADERAKVLKEGEDRGWVISCPSRSVLECK